MKMTGYRMQHSLREYEHMRDMAAAQFTNGLTKFKADKKVPPEHAMKSFLNAEKKIALIQEATGMYNLAVKVNVQGEEMTLSRAVKQLGGACRAEKMWRAAANDAPVDRYGYGIDRTRANDVEVAERTVEPEAATEEARKAARTASALREAIQVGNATVMEIESLSESDLL